MMAHQHEPRLRRLAVSDAQGPSPGAAASSACRWAAPAANCSGAGSPWYESWIEHPDADDPFWDTDADDGRAGPLRGTGAAAQRMAGPVPGSDPRPSTEHLRDRGVDVAMTVGPWTHTRDGHQGARHVCRRDADLAGRPPGRQPMPQRPQPGARPTSPTTAGSNLADWPPATGEGVMYLQPAGRLAAAPPPADAPPSSFRYDPAHPTPTVGGRLLARNSGYRDDTALGERADVLSFTSGPLDADLYVCGNPVVELAHECRHPALRPVRPDQRGRRARALPQRQRRIPPVRRLRRAGRSASSSTRSRTGSAPERGSGCSSPAGRIRASPATSAPVSRRSPAGGWSRRRTPSITGRVACRS